MKICRFGDNRLGIVDVKTGTVADVTSALRLLPAQNRLALTLNLSSRERLSGKVGSGHLGFDSMLRYDARDASVRLTQVRIDRLSFEAGAAAASLLAGLALLTLIAKSLLEWRFAGELAAGRRH